MVLEDEEDGEEGGGRGRWMFGGVGLPPRSASDVEGRGRGSEPDAVLVDGG